MAKLDRLVWAASDTYQVGDLYQGVRTSDAGLAALLADALANHRRPGITAPANLSVKLPPAGNQPATLYRGYQATLRTVDPARLILGFLHHLGMAAQQYEGLALQLGAVISGEHAVLTPARISTLPHLLGRTLIERGYRFVDAPLIDLNPATLELIVATPKLEVEVRPIEEWLGQSIAEPVTGNFRVTGAILETGPKAPSLLQVVAYLVGKARNLEQHEVPAAITGLLDSVGAMTVRAAGDQRELVAAVISELQ